MFDSLREQANSNPSPEEGDVSWATQGAEESKAAAPASPGFLGMTSAQRLIIAVLLLVAVCVLGSMCLLATGRIGAFW